ncbi:preprotein translocase subunit YajC [Gryllotalpicola reticulitermitis]|uniref:Preprotein translocase subunit YajC n=1 Tax=Gryllotalpicola reticulitermitis TaxID=1184153 RepID=A0ABV8Q869_9MICO
MGNSVLLPVMIVIIAFFFFWTWRGNRKRRRDEEQKTSQLVRGVEVMTNFGLFGTVDSIDLENNKVVLEVSPGTRITVHPQTIARIETPAESEGTEASTTTAATSSSAIEEANRAAQAQAAKASDQPEFGERTTPSRKSDD